MVLKNDSQEICRPGEACDAVASCGFVSVSRERMREDSETNTVRVCLIVLRSSFSLLLPFLIFSNLHRLQRFGLRYKGIRKKTCIAVYT